MTLLLKTVSANVVVAFVKLQHEKTCMFRVFKTHLDECLITLKGKYI